MNMMQRAVLEVYSNGEYAPYQTVEEVIEYSGDKLLSFLLTELSSEEDCADLTTATNRLFTVRDDIQLIIDKLESM